MSSSNLPSCLLKDGAKPGIDHYVNLLARASLAAAREGAVHGAGHSMRMVRTVHFTLYKCAPKKRSIPKILRSLPESSYLSSDRKRPYKAADFPYVTVSLRDVGIIRPVPFLSTILSQNPASENKEVLRVKRTPLIQKYRKYADVRFVIMDAPCQSGARAFCPTSVLSLSL